MIPRAAGLPTSCLASSAGPCGRALRHNSAVVLPPILTPAGGAIRLRKALWACIVVFSALASPADAAGIQLFNRGPALSGAIWYPCQAEPTHVDLGDLSVGVDYRLIGVKDCPLVAGTK